VGISENLKSTAATTIRIDMRKKLNNKEAIVKFPDVLRVRNEITNKIPAIASTIGYCHETGFLQTRHLPPKPTKLKIGIRSTVPSVAWQLSQYDLPKRVSRRTVLSITTFKKLPIAEPRIKKKIKIRITD